MENRQSAKLGLLVRQNKGRTEHPYYVTELSHVLRTELHTKDILDLEETDHLFSRHRDQSIKISKELGFAFKKVWKYEPTDLWLASFHQLGERLRAEQAVLFAGPYEFCGGVKLSVERALNRIIPILEFDRDTVRLQSLSSESGLLLDLFEEESERLVELVAWGLWKAVAAECA